MDEALKDLIANYKTTFYMLGSAVGPAPYPAMVKHFQSVIGQEAKEQILELAGRLPDYLVACVGGGSNAIGLFAPFFDDKDVKMIGVEPPVAATPRTIRHHHRNPGIIRKCYLLQDDEENPSRYSIAAGLFPASAGTFVL